MRQTGEPFPCYSGGIQEGTTQWKFGERFVFADRDPRLAQKRKVEVTGGKEVIEHDSSLLAGGPERYSRRLEARVVSTMAVPTPGMSKVHPMVQMRPAN